MARGLPCSQDEVARNSLWGGGWGVKPNNLFFVQKTAPGRRHQGSHRPFPSGKTSAPGSRDLGWTPLRHASYVAELKVCLLPKEETYTLQCLVRQCESTVQQQPAPNFQCPKVKDVCFLSTSQAQCTWGQGLCSLRSLRDPGRWRQRGWGSHRAGPLGSCSGETHVPPAHITPAHAAPAKASSTPTCNFNEEREVQFHHGSQEEMPKS